MKRLIKNRVTKSRATPPELGGHIRDYRTGRHPTARGFYEARAERAAEARAAAEVPEPKPEDVDREARLRAMYPQEEE